MKPPHCYVLRYVETGSYYAGPGRVAVKRVRDAHPFSSYDDAAREQRKYPGHREIIAVRWVTKSVRAARLRRVRAWVSA